MLGTLARQTDLGDFRLHASSWHLVVYIVNLVYTLGGYTGQEILGKPILGISEHMLGTLGVYTLVYTLGGYTLGV